MGANRSSLTAQYWMKVLLAAFAVLLLMVWEHVEALRLDRAVRTLHKEEDQLVFQNARMQAQINQWISPSHLTAVAKKDLHMIPIDSQHVIGVELHD